MSRYITKSYLIAAVSILLLAAANGVRADVIAYSSFGPGNGGNDYNTGLGWTVGNDFSGDNIAVGESFTPSQTGTLSKIVVALQFVAGTNAGTISLRADAGGVPGAVLESFNVGSLPTDDGAFHTPTTVNDALNVPLVAGTTYWVVASASATDSLAWMFSDSATGNHATSFDGGATWFANPDSQGAFRVTENLPTVPEPSSLTVLSIGLVMLAGKRLRLRR
jgi:hypothetical protein